MIFTTFIFCSTDYKISFTCIGDELSTLSIPSPPPVAPPPKMAVKIFRPMVSRLAHGDGVIPYIVRQYVLLSYTLRCYSYLWVLYCIRVDRTWSVSRLSDLLGPCCPAGLNSSCISIANMLLHENPASCVNIATLKSVSAILIYNEKKIQPFP